MREVHSSIAVSFIATTETPPRLGLVIDTGEDVWFRPLTLEDVQKLMGELATATAVVGHAMGEQDARAEVNALLDGASKTQH